MNCIFTCVFNEVSYTRMLFLMLESIFIYGNLRDDTEILIYTSTEFMSIIKHSCLYNPKIVFEINDTYNTIDKACKARLDLFQLKSVAKYDKIMYLDTDVLIRDDVNSAFDRVTDDILYVLEEGQIDSDTDFWGKSLFGNELANYPDKNAFSSGIMLFNTSEKIRALFKHINEDIAIRPHHFHDQPHIVYNAFKYGMFDSQILKDFAANNDHDICSGKIIHHFPGKPGIYEHKINHMMKFLNKMKIASVMKNIDDAKKYIDQHLMPIINGCGELLEGNIFMFHHTTTYTNQFLNKAKNISNMVLNRNVRNVMEIGFNSGFSTLLMLLSNPHMKISCFDLGEHSYTMPCFNKLKETFGDRLQITIGDSCQTLRQVKDVTYDLIHIDGGHSTEVAESDIVNCYRLSKKGSILIMDDYDFPNLHQLWDKYIRIYGLQELEIGIFASPHHDIKKVV